MSLSIFVTWTLNFCYLDYITNRVKKTGITNEVMSVDVLGVKKSCRVEKKFITW